MPNVGEKHICVEQFVAKDSLYYVALHFLASMWCLYSTVLSIILNNCAESDHFVLQVLKRQGYDEGCDIWSLGVLLYTMLAG